MGVDFGLWTNHPMSLVSLYDIVGHEELDIDDYFLHTEECATWNAPRRGSNVVHSAVLQ